jgi:hypothetical protein
MKYEKRYYECDLCKPNALCKFETKACVRNLSKNDMPPDCPWGYLATWKELKGFQYNKKYVLIFGIATFIGLIILIIACMVVK